MTDKTEEARRAEARRVLEALRLQQKDPMTGVIRYGVRMALEDVLLSLQDQANEMRKYGRRGHVEGRP